MFKFWYSATLLYLRCPLSLHFLAYCTYLTVQHHWSPTWLCINAVSLEYSGIPIIRTLLIRINNYPDQLGPSGKFVENSIKLNYLKITGYRIKYIQCYGF